MYLLTQSETLNDSASVTFTSASNTGNIIDGDLDTFSETASRTPNLTVDLGSRKVIDAVFLKGENLLDYDVKASNDNSTFTDLKTGITVPDDGNSFEAFTNTATYRYWRLTFSQRGTSDPNYRVAEIYLCRLLLDLNTDEKRPVRYRNTTPQTGVVAYDTYNRRTIQYKTGERAKVRLTFEWSNLDADVAEELESLWKGPPPQPLIDGLSTSRFRAGADIQDAMGATVRLQVCGCLYRFGQARERDV